MTSNCDVNSAMRDRKARARDGIRRAAGGLRDTIVGAARCERLDHPWVLPAAGFCAGFLIPFLFPDRRSRARLQTSAAGPDAG